MLRFIYQLYFFRLKNTRLDELYSRLVVRTSNYLLRAYYGLTGYFTRKRVLNSTEKPKLIVSLTTYPARIEKIWMVIETILDQTVKPDKIFLWLFKGEFNGISDMPAKLRSLEKRGLDIRFCDENLYPHKKYFYTMMEYPEAVVITIDDDVLYPSTLISDLLDYQKRFPNSITCTLSRRIRLKDKGVADYSEWEYINESTRPLYRNQMIGAGGVLYPPDSLDEELFNLEKLKLYALKTDDLWLKVMSLKKRTKVACLTGKYPRLFIPQIRKNDKPLMLNNVGKNQNDKNLAMLLENYDIDLESCID